MLNKQFLIKKFKVGQANAKNSRDENWAVEIIRAGIEQL
jgi:hypothetical protein